MADIYEIAQDELDREKYGPIQAHHFTDRVLEMAGLEIPVTDQRYMWILEGCKRVVESNRPLYYLADLHIPR